MRGTEPFLHLGRTTISVAIDGVHLLGASLRSRSALVAENLFLRKQLALYRERKVNPRRASDSLRLRLVLLARGFAWREALTIVQPATLLRWHRGMPFDSSGAGGRARDALRSRSSSND